MYMLSDPSPGGEAVRAAARVLRSLKFGVCRVDARTKRATDPGWTTRSADPDDFADGDMLGIMAGALSDGGRRGHSLIPIDLDADTAVAMADCVLPMTPMVEGRPGKPRSHRYFLVPNTSIPEWALSAALQASAAAVAAVGHPGPTTKSFRHVETGREIIRMVGTGGQTVAPPSVWVARDGSRSEPRSWCGGPEPGEPAVVPFPDLWDATQSLATACGAKPIRPVVSYTPLVASPVVSPVLPRRQFATARRVQLLRRVRKYLAKVPPAVSGCRGHDQTFAVACTLVNGWALDAETALEVLIEDYNGKCQPPWSLADLRHKIDDATSARHTLPRGHLVRRSEGGAA